MSRYSIDFSDELERLLDDVTKLKGINKAEAIRRALAHYAFFASEEVDNKTKKITISNEDDEVIKQIVFT